MDLPTKLEKLANKKRSKIGIGMVMDDSEGKYKRIEKIMASSKVNKFAEVLVFHSVAELISALKKDEISGAVRGTLPAKESMDELKSVFKVVSLYRSALICIDSNYCFFLAPVGIDEGIFIDERLKFIKLLNELLERLDIPATTAIISGGRLDDFGRSGLVDESLKAGEKLFDLTKKAGTCVEHYGILIEKAYTDSNIIIAPNGIVGNLLFRTLHFIGKARSFGAPILNLEKTFIDTSRSKEDYSDSIMLASALSRLKND